MGSMINICKLDDYAETGSTPFPVGKPREVHPRSNLDAAEDELPEARSGHRMVGTDSDFYAIGGYNPDMVLGPAPHVSGVPLLKELWRFNFSTRIWKRLRTLGSMPSELASHCVCMYKNNLLVFGGTGFPFGHMYNNALFSCNLDTLQWINVPTTGEHPTPGYGQSMYIVHDRLYVMGGTKGIEYNFDVHFLDLPTLTWTKLSPTGDPPDGRYRHEIVYWDQNFYVLGGGRALVVFSLSKVPCLNLVTEEWDVQDTVPDNSQGFPKPRKAHSCSQKGSDVYVCGGYTGSEIFNDLWHLELTTMQWTLFSHPLIEPVYFHSAVLTSNNTLYIFGGVNEVEIRRTNKVYAIQVDMSSLRELAWTTLTAYCPNMFWLRRSELFRYGVPWDLLERIRCQQIECNRPKKKWRKLYPAN